MINFWRARRNARLETGKKGPPKKKYVLHPGFVFSATDGDRHYITARQLAKLWGVPMNMCFVVYNLEEPIATDDRLRHLYPLTNGRYEHLEVRGLE